MSADLNASTDFAHTVSSGRWFQRIVVSTKKLFLYNVVLLSGIIILLVLLQTRFSRIFVVSQSLLLSHRQILGTGNLPHRGTSPLCSGEYVPVGFRFDGSLCFIESYEMLSGHQPLNHFVHQYET